MNYNKEFKTMYDVEGKKWKYGYNVYPQNINGRIFVTFFKNDYDEKIHFNDSGSVDIRAYLKPKTFQEMLAYANEIGWR